MEEQTEEYYRQKYLKYKAKYLALQEQSGGLTTKSGIYYLFVNTTNKDLFKIGSKIKSTLTKKEIKSFPSLKDMKKMFPDGVLINDKLLTIEYFNAPLKKKINVNQLFYKFLDEKCFLNPNEADKLTLAFEQSIKNINMYMIFKLIDIESINKVYKIRINPLGKNELLEEMSINIDTDVDKLFEELNKNICIDRVSDV